MATWIATAPVTPQLAVYGLDIACEGIAVAQRRFLPADLPTMLQYRTHAEKDSMFNTPPVFGIYVMGLVLKWIKQQGGLAAIETRNRRKAGKLYAFLDESRLFQPAAKRGSRSLMNVTFVTGDDGLDAEFVATAKQAGLEGLKGHRSVGGMRASLYNAFPGEGVDRLIDVMRRFEAGK